MIDLELFQVAAAAFAKSGLFTFATTDGLVIELDKLGLDLDLFDMLSEC